VKGNWLDGELRCHGTGRVWVQTPSYGSYMECKKANPPLGCRDCQQLSPDLCPACGGRQESPAWVGNVKGKGAGGGALKFCADPFHAQLSPEEESK
jgi:hypothetical protein